MKRNLTSLVIFLTALTVAWLAYGREESRQSQQNRENQRGLQTLSAEERAKLREERRSMSEDERQRLRSQMRERAAGGGLMSGRQGQLKVIEDIEKQLAKLKEAIKQAPDREEFRKLPDASPEALTKFREEWQKARQQQEQIVSTIQKQLIKLAGPKPAEQATRPDVFVNELKVIYGIAVKENAQKTAELIDKLIAKYRGTPQLIRPVQRSKPDEQQTKPKQGVESTASGKNTER